MKNTSFVVLLPGSCRRRLALALLFGVLLLTIAPAAAQTWQVRSGAPAGYLLRDGRRFFAIGTRVDGLKTKPVDETTFLSIREYFNTLWINIRDIDDPRHLYPDGIFTRLDYVRHDEGLFLAGDLAWRLQAEPGCIIDINGDGIFQPSEQRRGHRRVQPQAARRAMSRMQQLVSPPTGPKRSMIYYLMDEPDAGYATDHHWAFTDSLLKRFYDQRPEGSLAYIDLGPVTGSKLLYEKEFPDRAPDQGTPRFFAGLKHSYATTAENVRVTAGTYAPAADILGINSYDATNRRPALLGDAVSWIHEASGYKPVWPWVSAEQARYRDEASMYNTVRPQLFAAIVHGAGGVLFYNDQSVVARSDRAELYWDRMFDLVKEVNLFRDVLEEYTAVAFSYAAPAQWRGFERPVKGKKRIYYFAMNSSEDPQPLMLPGGGSATLAENDGGVWMVEGTTVRRLAPAANLSFEVWEESSAGKAPRAWQVQCASGTGISRETGRMRIGLAGLQLRDEAGRSGREAMVSQTIPCAHGEIYEAQGWCWLQQGAPALLRLEYLDSGGKVLKSRETTAPAVKEKWSLVRVALEAPARAVQLRLAIRSGSGKQTGVSLWDDMLLRIQ